MSNTIIGAAFLGLWIGGIFGHPILGTVIGGILVINGMIYFKIKKKKPQNTN